jgi:repressor LexA
MLSSIDMKALRVIMEMTESGEHISNLEEFARRLDLKAKSRASVILANLLKEGLIECDKTPKKRIKSSTVRLAKMQDARPVPILGRVAAGQPILANSGDIVEFVPLPARHVRGSEVYMLEVRGSSMTGDGLYEGDYVVVASDPKPAEGKIAVVLVEGEATIKHIQYEGESIRLVSSNSDYPDQIYDASSSPVIQGRVIGVVRWLES